MVYKHIKILLQGNGGIKSIIIKMRYVHQIEFERTPGNFNMEGIQGVEQYDEGLQSRRSLRRR